ncbi:hypothetical protein BDZ91DRAFT_710074 [Kalaharituber pfeilii]|nr:hypothetical protein BDZ91DRAFT_710074 [Kalaharituber pfeilii]
MSSARSLYRSLLRELLPLTSAPKQIKLTPTHQFLRSCFFSKNASSNDTLAMGKASQIKDYLKAQRMYAALLERYNPNLRIEDEERVRLTARRVGFELPKAK